MKANSSPPWRAIAVALLAGLAAACVAPPAAPPPLPAPAPAPRPAPPPRAAVDWRDAPISPGTWSWSEDAGQSVARFGNGALSMRCRPGSGQVELRRAGTVPAAAAMRVTTTTIARSLGTTAESGAVVAVLPARDPLLDAMVYSRGRFAVEATGLAPLYLPSWPEVARVVQDCR